MWNVFGCVFGCLFCDFLDVRAFGLLWWTPKCQSPILPEIGLIEAIPNLWHWVRHIVSKYQKQPRVTILTEFDSILPHVFSFLGGHYVYYPVINHGNGKSNVFTNAVPVKHAFTRDFPAVFDCHRVITCWSPGNWIKTYRKPPFLNVVFCFDHVLPLENSWNFQEQLDAAKRKREEVSRVIRTALHALESWLMLGYNSYNLMIHQIPFGNLTIFNIAIENGHL